MYHLLSRLSNTAVQRPWIFRTSFSANFTTVEEPYKNENGGNEIY